MTHNHRSGRGKYVSSREIAEQVKQHVSYKIRQRDIARKLGVSNSYLSDFLAGNREAGPKILKALGFQTVPYYRKAKP